MRVRGFLIGMALAVALVGCGATGPASSNPGTSRRLAAAPARVTVSGSQRSTVTSIAVLHPPIGEYRIPDSVVKAYKTAAAAVIERAQRDHLKPATAVGLPPQCQAWLGESITALFCSASPPKSRPYSGPGQLEISATGMRGGAQGAITQLTGLPLRHGDVLHLRAVHEARGWLVIESVPKQNVVSYSRFDIDLPAGSAAQVRYLDGRGPILEHQAGLQSPARAITIAQPLLPPPPLPNSYGRYQECAKVGPTGSISDPTADVTLNTANIPAPRSYHGLDITHATIAHSDRDLCLDIQLTSPPVPGNDYHLTLRAPTATNAVGAEISISLITATDRVVSIGQPLWALQPTNGYVTVPRALIGVSGNNLSLMIDRSQLAPNAPLTAFRWSIDADTNAAPGIQPYDCATTSGDALYPPSATASPPPTARCIL